MTKFLCGECIHNSDKGGGCLIPKNLGYVDNCNRYLPKEKPIVQTNEEYIHSLNTEQLAEWIAHQSIIVLLENQNNHSLRMTYPAYWVEWLKQPHNS